jgi:hypothetical protein
MAWTAPMTAVANTAFTAAQFNTHVRDNLLETSPAKATAGVTTGSILVKAATNSVAFRTPSGASVNTQQSTTSTSYTNLATNGPAVTVTTGTRALVIINCSMLNSSTNSSFASFAVTGATSVSATDDYAIRHRDGTGSSGEEHMGRAHLFTSLTAGSNTFTMKYRVIGGTGSFDNREIIVIPF